MNQLSVKGISASDQDVIRGTRFTLPSQTTQNRQNTCTWGEKRVSRRWASDNKEAP